MFLWNFLWHEVRDVPAQKGRPPTPQCLALDIYVQQFLFKVFVCALPRIPVSIQGAISCATARPPVAASAGALTLAGSPSIRAFVAKSILSRFTRFWMYHFQPQHTRFCREISFVALLGVSFSAIHGDEWLFHDYDASAGLLTLAQGCQR